MSLLLTLDHDDEDQILANLNTFFRNTSAAHVLEKHLIPTEQARNGQYEALMTKKNLLRQKYHQFRDEWNREERRLTKSGGTVTPEELARHARLKNKMDCACEVYMAAQDERLPGAMPLDPIFEFVRDANTPYRDARVELKLAKGQSLLEALQSNRAEHTTCRDRQSGLRSALLPYEESFARLVADIDQQAENGKPAFDGTARLVSNGLGIRARQGHVEWPISLVETGARLVELPNSMAFLTWMFRDAIIERGRVELKSIYEGKDALSVAEREKMITTLDSDLLDLERYEEAIIEACELKGIPALRRPLMSPMAVLGVTPGK